MENSIILVDKPSGLSSFGVVAKVRHKLKENFGHKIKVGHTGTLDPFATGLLILLTGKMTKKSNDFLKLDKTYEANLKLGFTSTTGDLEGEITPYLKSTASISQSTQPVVANQSRSTSCLKQSLSKSSHFTETETETEPAPKPIYSEQQTTQPNLVPSRSEVESAIKSFVGEIQQTVPKFSAVKINGERAYKLARAGKDFTPPTRKVTIYSIEILSYEYPNLKIRCHVSSGTYIRTLGEDIGKTLNTGAFLTSLRRLEIGNYSVEDPKTIKLNDLTS